MPINLVFLSFKKTYPIAHVLRIVWACIIFLPCGLWVNVKGKENLKGLRNFIYTPNHSSYIDIPTCALALPGILSFMAKHELAKIPIFGYFFKTIDLGVKRRARRDAYKAFIKMGDKLEEGQKPIIFPEGTIPQNAPKLGNFKLGAFKMAIEKGVPIVPVSMPKNSYCFPDKKKIILRQAILPVIIHRPIPTANLKAEDAPALMQQVYNIIEKELKRHNPEIA